MIVLGAERVTVWRRRAAWAVVAFLVAGGFAVAGPGTEPGRAADCVVVGISDFGSAPLTAAPGAQCYLVTTDNAASYLIKAGDGTRPSVIGPGEQHVLPQEFATLDGFMRFPLQAGTTYRVETSEPTFAVYNPSSSDGCSGLGTTTWAAAETPVAVDGDEVECRTFVAEPGGVMRLGLARSTETSVFDGDGDFLCGGEAIRPDDSRECSLDQGPGPYRVLVVNKNQGPGSPAPVTVVDTASTQGCRAVTATRWNAVLPAYSRWLSGRWQCFRLDPEATGRHLLRFLGETSWATYELWHVGVGQMRPPNGSETAAANLYEGLEAGSSYRYIVEGNPAGLGTPGYRFGYLDLSDDDGCQSGIDLDWGAPAIRGTSPAGGMDCYSLPASEGDRYRVQIDIATSGENGGSLITDATGADACAPSGGGGCRFAGPGPYRLLVGQTQALSYALTVTDVASPGCATPTPLATYGQPLPLVAQGASSSTYQCFRLHTSAATQYRFSSWTEPGASSREFELWKAGADQTSPGSGLVEPEKWTTLRPDTDYLLVAAGAGPGEYRAGLYDVYDGPGCTPVADVSWSAPALAGQVGKGELDCHEVVADAGDRYRLEWQTRTELLNVDGSPCDATCVVPAPTRLRAITDASDDVALDYRFWLNELGDASGCATRLSATEPLADPLVAQLGPQETACFVVDTRGVGLEFWSNSADAHVTPYLISALGERCDLWIENQCGPVAGRRTVVMRNHDPTSTRAAVLLRETDAQRYKAVCDPVTSAGFRGVLDGQFDEECFTFALPAGTHYNMGAVGTSGSAQPFALVFGNGEVCENFFCTAPGGTQVLRVINRGSGAGGYRVDFAGIPATFDLGPYLTGKPKVGATLRVVHGGTSPDDARVSVRWLRDGKPVRSGLSYRVSRMDRGHVISARVTVSSPGFQTTKVTLKGVKIRRR